MKVTPISNFDDMIQMKACPVSLNIVKAETLNKHDV